VTCYSIINIIFITIIIIILLLYYYTIILYYTIYILYYYTVLLLYYYYYYYYYYFVFIVYFAVLMCFSPELACNLTLTLCCDCPYCDYFCLHCAVSVIGLVAVDAAHK
jgi:hypothetical protein